MSKKFYIYVTIFLSMLACVFFIGHSFEFAVKHPELLRYYQFSDNYVLSKNREQNRFKIGIIDGPINLKHPELEDVLIEQSFFVNDYTENDIEHATSVAGVISAKNNSIGIKGILEDVFIINAVVLSNSRVEQVDLANAIRHCVEKSVDVINISIEIYEFSDDLLEAIDLANEAEIQIFMANGNGGFRKKLRSIEKPNKENLIFVGMLDRNDEESSSNMEIRKADIFELGENIISLSNESYKVYNGTSYSCAITTSKYIKKEAKYEK